MSMDTIDIEDLANQFKDDFVSIFTEIAMKGIAVEAPFILGTPFYGLIEDFVRWLVTLIGTTGGLVAFIFNTRVFTTDQGSDYISQAQVIKNLPEDVSDDDWDKAERKRLAAARNLINFQR